MDAKGDAVYNVRLHAMEDLSCNLEGSYDRTQALVEKNHSSSATRCIAGAFYCNSTIGLLQARSVIFRSGE